MKRNPNHLAKAPLALFSLALMLALAWGVTPSYAHGEADTAVQAESTQDISQDQAIELAQEERPGDAIEVAAEGATDGMSEAPITSVEEESALAPEASGDITFASGMPSSSSDYNDVYIRAKYNDEYFRNGSDVFNTDLAYSSMCLAAATMNSNRFGDDYTKKPVNIKSFLQNVGCKDITVNVGYTTLPTSESNIGVAIGHKALAYDDAELFVVGIRGGNYQGEWAGNVRVGTKGFHQGFAEARDSVLAFILPYIKDHSQGRTVKIWISGYSRSGAVSNLVGGWLCTWLKDSDTAGVTPTIDYAEDYDRELMRNTTAKTYDLTGVKMSTKNIFCYPVNAPQGVLMQEALSASKYCKGIHNLTNADDWVPQVAPHVTINDFDFWRYGVDHDITKTFTPEDLDVDWNSRAKSVWQSRGFLGGENMSTMNRFRSLTGRDAIPWRFRQFFFSKTQFIPGMPVVDGIQFLYNKYKKQGERTSAILSFDKKGEGNRYISLSGELVDMQGAYFGEFITFFMDACAVTSREDYVNRLQPAFEFLMHTTMGMTKARKGEFRNALRTSLERRMNAAPKNKLYRLLKGIVLASVDYDVIGLTLIGGPVLNLCMDSSVARSITSQAISDAYNKIGLAYNQSDANSAFNTVANIVTAVYNKEQSIGKLNFYHVLTLVQAVDTIAQAHQPEHVLAWHPSTAPASASQFVAANVQANGDAAAEQAQPQDDSGIVAADARAMQAQPSGGVGAEADSSSPKKHDLTVRIEGGNVGIDITRYTGEMLAILPQIEEEDYLRNELEGWQMSDVSNDAWLKDVTEDYVLTDDDPEEILLRPLFRPLATRTIRLYANYTDDYATTDPVAEFSVIEGDDLRISNQFWECDGSDQDDGVKSNGYYVEPERVGYTLCAWTTAPNADGESYTYGLEDTISHEEIEGDTLDLFAYWYDDALWMVNYHANRNDQDGETTSYFDDAEDDQLVAEANEFTNDGYTFAGWNTKADGSGTAIQPDSSISLEEAGVSSRDELHKRYETVDEDDTATLQSYVDDATLDLYAQWRKDEPVPSTGGNDPKQQDTPANVTQKQQQETTDAAKTTLARTADATVCGAEVLALAGSAVLLVARRRRS